MNICHKDDRSQSYRKFTGRYILTESLEKINHLMYTDDIKVVTKNGKRVGNPYTGSENIQLEHKDEI